MIPGNILKKHVIEAIEFLEANGVPNNRLGKKFDLFYNNKKYPPKYTISIANKFANDTELEPDTHSGGNESNNFLIRHGFEIIDKKDNTVYTRSNFDKKFRFIDRQNKHNPNSRCTECKNTIYEMLRTIYGTIKIEHKFSIKTKIEDYKDLYLYNFLEKIYNSLVKNRGFDKFNKARILSPCDIYVVENDFIVELDEIQHFSKARLVSLLNYPSELKLKYNKNYWIELCKKYNASDNDPIYRDEQRAWYDSLRDILPLLDNSFQPTLRIFTGDYEWCSLNQKKHEDIETFKNFIGENN